MSFLNYTNRSTDISCSTQTYRCSLPCNSFECHQCFVQISSRHSVCKVASTSTVLPHVVLLYLIEVRNKTFLICIVVFRLQFTCTFQMQSFYEKGSMSNLNLNSITVMLQYTVFLAIIYFLLFLQSFCIQNRKTHIEYVCYFVHMGCFFQVQKMMYANKKSLQIFLIL